ncbi:heavy-metal-associated domain-containing protein [Sphingomonas cavernae]|uniref:heavy-metal-associated domain-containing protein n=1 Tax=Sphingomonas cavernae TaxID=2320861 RepID=UPI001600E6AD|nr:heavy-metal-associated domain-containing protein [Sphingomonas cavernae]
MTLAKRLFRPLPVLSALLLVGGASVAVLAQIEGSDRGVVPIDTSGSLEVTGVKVDVYGKTADAARYGGWRLAQRKAWKALWTKHHPGSSAPGLPDSTLDSIVGGIVVEDEQIGPNRYVARLGVLFDRARAGQILGVGGVATRSAPYLIIPVQWSGGRPESFEHRTEWQQAWARFRTGSSPIDYVRPSGTGSDPLLLNAAQAERRNRVWWRVILDQFGAADVLIPKVRLERLYPGGPVTGHFTAGYGPDSKILTQFSLRVRNAGALGQMLDEGVRRIDAAYSLALNDGRLRPDPSLIIEEPVDPDALEDVLEIPLESADALSNATAAASSTITIQFDTPDAGALSRGESAIRSVPGISGATTTSLAIGGVSVMRVSYAGDIATLRASLAARGWQVQEGAGVLRIRRGGAQPTPPPAQPANGNVSGG